MHEADPNNVSQFLDQYRDARRRLFRCYEMYRNGFYENAVALAMQYPELLPECGRLVSVAPSLVSQLPEDAKKQFENEKIEEAYVAALQESFDKAAAVAPLNDQLRKLVFIRALAPSRLSVMRRILSVEPSHPFMEQDIRDLEQAWFRDIPEYANNFAREGNSEAILEMAADLSNSNYLEAIPSPLMGILEKALRSAQAKQLPLLEEEVNRCHENEDLPGLTDAFAKLDALIVETGQSPEEFEQRLRSARVWMKDRQREVNLENEKVESRANLSRMIQNPKISQADLEIAHAKAAALGVVDQHLEEQFQARMSSTARTRQGSFFAVGVAAFLVVALVPTAIYFVGQHWAHAAAVQGAIARVKSGPLQNEQYEEALATIDDLPEDIQRSDEIVDFRTEVVKERERYKDFQEVLTKIEAPQPPLMAESAINEMIQEAEEKRCLDDKRREVLASAKTERLQRNATYLDTEKSKLVSWRQEFSDRLAQFADQLHPGIDHEVLHKDFQRIEQEAQAVMQRSDEFKLLIGDQADEILQLAKSELDATSKKLEGLEAYEKYVHSLNQRPSTEQIDHLLGDYYQFQEIEMPQNDGLGSIYQSIGIVAEHLDQNMEPPAQDAQALQMVPEFRDAYKFCREELRRSTSRGNFTDLVSKWREKNQYIVDIWMYREPEGIENHHYFSEEPKPGQVGPSPIGTNPPSSNYAIPNGARVLKSPQSLFADAVLPKLDQATAANWHETFAAVYEQLRAGEPEQLIDPVLRVIMMQQLIQAGRAGSGSLNEFFNESKAVEAIEDTVKQLNQEPISWWDNNTWPRSPFKTARSKAKQMLDGLPPVNWRGYVAADQKRLQRVAGTFRICEVCTQLKGTFKPLPFVPIEETAGAHHYVLDPEDPTVAIDLADTATANKYELEYLPVITVLP